MLRSSTAAILLFALPAAAWADAASYTVYERSKEWSIQLSEEPAHCVAKQERNSGSWIVFFLEDSGLSMTILDRKLSWVSEGKSYTSEIFIDNERWPGTSTASLHPESGALYFSNLSAPFAKAISRGHRISLAVDGARYGPYSLAGSTKMIAELNNCLRYAISRSRKEAPDPAPRSETVISLPDNTPIYCRDSTQQFQPMLRTSYSDIVNSFVRQFGWQASLTMTSPTLGILLFASGEASNDGERIYYDVEPHEGPLGPGLGLLHMHVRLDGIHEDLSANEMCWKTFDIVNIR